MRVLILLLVATLGLAACNRGSQVGNTANIQENLSAAAFESNDITAIDAVTGEDANMAADVNYSDLGGNNASTSSNRASTGRPSAGRPASRPAPAESRPEPQPANTTQPAEAATNNAA